VTHRWDHFGGTYACDVNFEGNYTHTSVKLFSGKNSILRRCLYGQGVHQWQMNYATSFWEAYPDVRKLMRTHFSEAHESLGELVQYIDDDMVEFLDNFHKKGYLDDTVLLFMSDHGAHPVTFKIPLVPDNSRSIENYLPMQFVVVPKTLQKEYHGFLKGNQQALISSHDVYATLSYIATNKQERHYAYIAEKVPESRDCTDTSVFIGECWCMNDLDKLQEQLGTTPMFSFSF
jgi:arylsulfatase A-like enzyme